MLVFSIKKVSKGGVEYSAGQFIVASAVDGAAMVTAGTAVACPFDPLKITLDNKTAAVAAPASANFTFAFGARKAVVVPPAAPAAITVNVTAAAAGAGNPATIQFAGGPAKAAGTVTVTLAVSGSAVAGSPFTVNVAKGDTIGVVGASVMAALAGVGTVACTTGAAGQVVVTPNPATGTITTLTAVMAGTTR